MAHNVVKRQHLLEVFLLSRSPVSELLRAFLLGYSEVRPVSNIRILARYEALFGPRVKEGSPGGHHRIQNEAKLPLILTRVSDLIFGRISVYQLPILTVTLLIKKLVLGRHHGWIEHGVGLVEHEKVDNEFADKAVEHALTVRNHLGQISDHYLQNANDSTVDHSGCRHVEKHFAFQKLSIDSHIVFATVRVDWKLPILV